MCIPVTPLQAMYYHHNERKQWLATMTKGWSMLMASE
jgi:hypothetical protein